MAAKARRKQPPGAKPPRKGADTYGRVRALLNVCVQLLGAEAAQDAPEAPAAPTPDLTRFTERELEFMRLARHPDSWPYTYIAIRMGLKLPTLHYLRRKLFGKLRVKSRISLALLVRDWALG